MSRPRVRATVLPAFVCLGLGLCVGPSARAGGPEASAADSPVEGPARPEPRDAPSQPPAPTLGPTPPPDGPPAPGIEFAVPPPEDEEPVPAPQPPPEEVFSTFPDPGIAPTDGVNMLVLGGTTTALTIAGVTAGLIVGLDRGVELEWLLPSTIVPAVGLLAFSGGGLYLGIKRARAYRRWEIGYRVIGLPQGGGLLIGGSFTLLGALGLTPAGAVLIKSDPSTGIALISVGAAAAVATPIMFVLGVRNQRRYERTGGWKRRPVPPLPPGAVQDGATGRVELRPLILPLYGGVSIGASGRF